MKCVKAMEDYLDFVDYGGATIFSEQIAREDWKKFHIIDARDKNQYAKDHIPGAVNIEWRQVLAQRSSIPKDDAGAHLLQHGQPQDARCCGMKGATSTTSPAAHGVKLRGCAGRDGWHPGKT
jgi:Rhodanese-like domain